MTDQDTLQNDTYGEMTQAELAGLREQALPCTRCGMLATVDPVFHQARYSHAPQIREDGVLKTWNGSRWQVTPE